MHRSRSERSRAGLDVRKETRLKASIERHCVTGCGEAHLFSHDRRLASDLIHLGASSEGSVLIT